MLSTRLYFTWLLTLIWAITPPIGAVNFPNGGKINITAPFAITNTESEGQLLAKLSEIAAYKFKKVVIDAGHGGKDAGARGRSYREKDITLGIALKVGAAIKANFPEVEVIYTRSTDVFIELYRRAEIANQAHADLFISIHCNSLPQPNNSVSGTETYVLGLERQVANLEVARRENESALLETNYEERYGKFNKKSAEGFIFSSVAQSAYLEQSIMFAQSVEDRLKTRVGKKSKGVKQAGFLVIRETAMPSVLIETGFLSNNTEEQYLGSEAGQQEVADGIFDAFSSYKMILEGVTAAVLTPEPTKPTTKPTEPTAPLATVKPKRIEQAPTTTALPKNTPKSNPTPTTKPVVVYRVQVAASGEPIETTDPKWKLIDFLFSTKENGMFKYMAGDYATEAEANAVRDRLSKGGWKGAFVVAYRENTRISMDDARKL